MRLRRSPGSIEFVFNTPSHHRAHHGSDEIYLDRSFRPTRVAFHEFAAIARDGRGGGTRG